MMPSRFPEIQSYPHIRGLCADALDLYIADLRSMLQLPLRIRREMGPGPDILLVDAEGGGNFASCTLLLDVIAGLSVCLYSRQGRIGLETSRDRGDRYREFLQQYYPWEYESLDSGQVSEILWEFLRNPLVHNLGILPFRGIAAIERINSRLKYGRRLDSHCFRGLEKIGLHCKLAVLSLLVGALVKAQKNELDELRVCARKIA